MKKAMHLLLSIAAAGVMLTGCGNAKTSAFSPAEPCVYVAQDGSISSAMVRSTEDVSVEEKDLKQYLEAAIIRYNKERGYSESAENKAGASGKLPVALQSVNVKNGVMTAVFDYASAEDLVNFRQTDDNADENSTVSAVEVKKMADADSAGWLAETFVKPDGSSAAAEEIKKESEASVACIEGGGAVMFSGKVLYMTEGITKKDEYTVTIPDGGKTYVVFK